jgi:streptogramin lyase
MLILPACSQAAAGPTPTSTIANPTASPKTPKSEPTATFTAPTEALHASPTAFIENQPENPSTIRQGAAYGFLEPYQAEDVALGEYRFDQPNCGSPWLSGMVEDFGETLLRLEYITPLLPAYLEIYAGDLPIGIKRIELLNAFSGLGAVLDPPNTTDWENLDDQGACSKHLVIPAKVDFKVDTVLIEFDTLDSAIQVAAVEIIGELNAYQDAPVFWRVPLPSTPVDIAMGKNGLVHVITEPNYLFTYDVEGNQLRQFSVPSESNLTSVTTDSMGNLLVTDAAYGWFIRLSPDGEQLSTGVDDFAFPQTGFNPTDGNLYLLSNNTLRVYDPETAEKLWESGLDNIHTYTSLAFTPQGQLYTMRDFNWDATLVMLDPLTGAELDAFPLLSSTRGEVVAKDIAVDESGNITILFSSNIGQIGIHQLDPQGILFRRFGTLSSDALDWPEGSFLDPASIAVSPDGRFIIVADGYGEMSYLTAFLMELNQNQD